MDRASVKDVHRPQFAFLLSSIRKRVILLSITHKLSSQHEAELDVGEAGHTTPHDDVSWRWIFGVRGEQAVLAEGQRYLRERWENGRFLPKIAQTFPLEQAAEAYRFLGSNAQIGKIVIDIEHRAERSRSDQG